jgi:hypothetical protein
MEVLEGMDLQGLVVIIVGLIFTLLAQDGLLVMNAFLSLLTLLIILNYLFRMVK